MLSKIVFLVIAIFLAFVFLGVPLINLYLSKKMDAKSEIKKFVKVDDHRHAKMKDLAIKNNRTVQDEYAAAVDAHMTGAYQRCNKGE